MAVVLQRIIEDAGEGFWLKRNFPVKVTPAHTPYVAIQVVR
jgi:hypothetical protein